jgi:hypothetical protein
MKRTGILSRSKSAFTVAEVMIAAAIAGMVSGAAFVSLTALQRGFGFCTVITDTETNQVRLFDSMALDFRNAQSVAYGTSGNSNVFPVTMTIPNLYSGYETAGDLAGDPGRTASRANPSVNTSGKINYSTQITVTYDVASDGGSGQIVNRTVSWSDSTGSYSATRPVASLNSGASVSFQNASGNLMTASDTSVVITMTVTAPRQTTSATTPLTTTLTHTVFLRGEVLK